MPGTPAENGAPVQTQHALSESSDDEFFSQPLSQPVRKGARAEVLLSSDGESSDTCDDQARQVQELVEVDSSESGNECKDEVSDESPQQEPLCMEISGKCFHLEGHLHSMLYVHQVRTASLAINVSKYRAKIFEVWPFNFLKTLVLLWPQKCLRHIAHAGCCWLEHVGSD
jgi:hypothetical protein